MAKPAVGLKSTGDRGGVVAQGNNGNRTGPGEPGNPAGGYRGTAGGHHRTAPAGREPGGPAVRRRTGSQDAGPQTGRQGQEGGGGSKEAPQEASTGLCPAADGTRRAGDPRSGVLLRMPYCPERGLGAADPGGHRTSGVSCRSYRTRLHRPEVSAVPETEAAPGPPPGSGRGPAAPGDQPGQPDCGPAGGRPAAHKDHPMVPANGASGASIEAERRGHRRCGAASGAAGPASRS